MSKIIACYKWVLDEAYIRINANLSIDTNQTVYKISNYDKNTIEAAVRAADSLEGTAVGLTFGSAETQRSLKDALSRGLNESYWVNSEKASQADGSVTAKTLAEAIRKMKDVDLIICSEGASDTFARQVGSRIGAELDLPVISSVCKIAFSDNTITAVRKLHDSFETVKVALPCVLSVLPEINEAPVPGLKAVLAAGKKPIVEFTPEDLSIAFEPKTCANKLQGYVMSRKNVVIEEGTPEEKVAALVEYLRKEGIV